MSPMPRCCRRLMRYAPGGAKRAIRSHVKDAASAHCCYRACCRAACRLIAHATPASVKHRAIRQPRLCRHVTRSAATRQYGSVHCVCRQNISPSLPPPSCRAMSPDAAPNRCSRAETIEDAATQRRARGANAFIALFARQRRRAATCVTRPDVTPPPRARGVERHAAADAAAAAAARRPGSEQVRDMRST